MSKQANRLLVVVMAKLPQPGMVKTRLVSGGLFDDHQAADLAWAMLECIVQRLVGVFGAERVMLAVSPDGGGSEVHRRLEVSDLQLFDQGSGSLGERINRVWRRLDPGQPVAFFGCDSPDVPVSALEMIGPALAHAKVAAGPTNDGGYWTLAARSYQPQVLDGIDWGSPSVYDQTRSRAREAGLGFERLPDWHDVDEPEDVTALRHRLGALCRSEADPQPELNRLADRLERLLAAAPGRKGGTR